MSSWTCKRSAVAAAAVGGLLAGTQPWAAAAGPAVVQAPALPGAPPISGRDRVYTADQTSNTVTVINPKTDQVLGTIALGSQRLDSTLSPQYLDQVDVHGLGFSRDGRYLDVISVTTNTVTVIRTADNTIMSRTYVGRAAHEGFFAPDGRHVWVADRGTSTVDIVDGLAGGITGHIRTAAGPSKVLFSPDGRLAYVNHILAATVEVIDVAQRRVVERIRGLADVFSSDMGLSPDGRQLWVAHKKTGQVSVIDTHAREVVDVLNTGPDTNHPNFVTFPDAAYAYLTVGGLNETKIYRRDRAHPRLVAAVKSTGVEPHGIWPSPDNTKVYVVNEHSDTVDVIDTHRRQVIDTLRVGQEGQALVYVANAVPLGTGTAHLTRQGLTGRVVNSPATVSGSPGKVLLTVRAVQGLDMVQLAGSGLTPNGTYTAYAQRGGQLIPFVTFTADAAGSAPQVLSFFRFFGVYSRHTVVVRPGAPG